MTHLVSRTLSDVVIVALMIWFRCWVAAMLWNWYIVPLGFPSVIWVHTMAAAGGLSMVGSRPQRSFKHLEYHPSDFLVWGAIIPLLVLLLGEVGRHL